MWPLPTLTGRALILIEHQLKAKFEWELQSNRTCVATLEGLPFPIPYYDVCVNRSEHTRQGIFIYQSIEL